jgi:hypothetical protein
MASTSRLFTSSKCFPRWINYIAIDTASCLADCSEVYLSQISTLGINHTGAAESANKMIQASPRSVYFFGICEAYSRTHELKAAVSQANVVRQFETSISSAKCIVSNCRAPL